MLVIVLSAEVTAVRKIEKVSVPAVLVGRHSWQISTLANNISLDSGKDMQKTKCDKAMESYDGGGVIIFDGVVREGQQNMELPHDQAM